MPRRWFLHGKQAELDGGLETPVNQALDPVESNDGHAHDGGPAGSVGDWIGRRWEWPVTRVNGTRTVVRHVVDKLTKPFYRWRQRASRQLLLRRYRYPISSASLLWIRVCWLCFDDASALLLLLPLRLLPRASVCWRPVRCIFRLWGCFIDPGFKDAVMVINAVLLTVVSAGRGERALV